MAVSASNHHFNIYLTKNNNSTLISVNSYIEILNFRLITPFKLNGMSSFLQLLFTCFKRTKHSSGCFKYSYYTIISMCSLSMLQHHDPDFRVIVTPGPGVASPVDLHPSHSGVELFSFTYLGFSFCHTTCSPPLLTHPHVFNFTTHFTYCELFCDTITKENVSTLQSSLS